MELNNGGESFDHSEDTSYRLLSNGEKHKKGFKLEKKHFYFIMYYMILILVLLHRFFGKFKEW